MGQEPVKPINEIERKTWVSDQDLILILDAETNEARLAPKEELKWEKGDQWLQGERWEVWPQWWVWPAWPEGNVWPQGQKGERGEKGDPFKYSDFTPEQLAKLKGEKGERGETWPAWPEGQKGERGEKGERWPAGSGAGDMLKENNLSDLTDIDQARRNLWVPSFDQVYTKEQVYIKSESYSKEEVNDALSKKADLTDGKLAPSLLPSPIDQGAESLSNKKETIEWNQTSNLFYPTIKAVWDWVTGLLSKKADLVNGKVPASQLPEVSQIDESNLVHKSWDEVIEGKKTFKDAPSLATDIGWDTNIVLRKFHDVRWSKIRILFKRWSWTSENPRPANVWDVMGAINFEDAVEWNSYFGIEVRKWQGKGKAIISESDLHIWWKRPIDIHVNDQNRTGERQSRTPTCGSSTITKHHCRYKVIGKICYFLVEVYINNVQWETPWFTLPVVRKNYNTEFPIAGYCARRWEHPVKDSRWVLSFNGSNRISTLNSVDMWVLIQSWEYIVRANWCYEIE